MATRTERSVSATKGLRGRGLALALLLLLLAVALFSPGPASPDRDTAGRPAHMLRAMSGKLGQTGCQRATFRVVIDVGHTAEAPGAISARGIPEYQFNLRLAREVERALLDAGFTNSVLLVTLGRPSAASISGLRAPMRFRPISFFPFITTRPRLSQGDVGVRRPRERLLRPLQGPFHLRVEREPQIPA